MDDINDLLTAAGLLVTASIAIGVTILGWSKGRAVVNKLVK